MKIAGICEAGAWRAPGYASPEAGPVPIEPDPRFSPDDQQIFLVRGDHAGGLGILDGSLLCTVVPSAIEDGGRKLRTGDVVLVRQANGTGLFEITAREWQDTRDGVRLSAKPLRGEVEPLSPGKNVEVIGLILRNIRVFGLQV